MDHGPEYLSPLHREHARKWRDCLYVYPVISRRAKGLSIGVNLNRDQRCNFSCVYCQVLRHGRHDALEVDLDVLRDELTLALDEAISGELWRRPPFDRTPAPLRRLNDIAFSGDGEPTCVQAFDKAVQVAADAKRRAPADVKLVVITNSTNLDSPQVQRALPILDAANGEIWAKLDAGTEAYFRRVNRPAPGLTLAAIIDKIADVARGRDIVIQTLLCRLEGLPPPEMEIAAYAERLREIIAQGGRIKCVQLHTVARPPAAPGPQPLSPRELDAIAERLSADLTPLTIETYHGSLPE